MAASDVRSYLLAAEVATEIVLQKLEILLSHPVCVECLSMQTRTRDAMTKLVMIQKSLSTQDRPQRAMEWLGWLLHAMSDAEEFIDKFHLREGRKRHEALHMATRPFAALVSKYKLWRDLSIMANEIKELCHDQFLEEVAEGKRKNEPAGSSPRASVPWQGKKLAWQTNFWGRQALTNFVCHKAEREDIMKRIMNGWWKIEGTSIWGVQGIGKTFLARWVYSQAKYMGYELRAWVHVSGSLDKREFLLEILKQVERLGREMKDMGIQEIKNMLLRKLAESKGFLIVLDDVQLSDEPLLRELVMSILLFSNGHIITTTQDDTIADFMNTSTTQPIKLKKLGDEESQRMLAWKLHGVSEGEKLSNKEKDILQMCRGLPLCISLLGGFLLDAGEHERAALVEEGFMMTLSDVLQLSCHRLPVHLKPYFVYMALFPVTFPIPTRRLVRLWLAEGLLDSECFNIKRERTILPEDVGQMLILELADRSVIDVVSWRADGSPKACQMLTALHGTIRPIAMSTGLIHVHADICNPTGQQQQLPAQLLERTKVRWLAEHTSRVTEIGRGSFPDLYLGHVRSFLSFYKRRGILTKDISTFLGNMTSKTAYSLLRVLDLEGVYKPSLQGVLHKLALLRYLGLRCTVLDSLPTEVMDLHYLETLDIKHTNITSLPSSFWKARNLRHLHLNWFYINLKTILQACSDNVMALTKLQTLSGLVIGEVKENLMRDHVDSLTTLTTLKLFLRRSDKDTSGAAGKAVADWISSRLTNLQYLTLGVTEKAKPAEAQPAKEATKVAETVEEAKQAKEAMPQKEATTVAKPAEEAEPMKEATEKAKRAEGAKPATSQIGLLPKLSLAKKHQYLLELYLVGQLEKPIWTELLPGSLRVLTLSGSKVKKDMMPELGSLLRNLRTFRLFANSFQGKSMTFTKDGFPSLKTLKIWKLSELENVIIEQEAMPRLKELEFRGLDRMKTVEGIYHCVELENIWVVVKMGDQRLFEHLAKEKAGSRTNLYRIEETETPGSTDDYDKDDRYR